MESHAVECLDFERIRELLAGYALCGLGRSLAVGIRPATKVQMVKRWLDQVDEMQRAEAELGPPPFAGITDVRELVRKAAPPLKLLVEEVAQIGRTLAATHDVAAYVAKLPQDAAELRVLTSRIGDFRSIADRIGRVIDERGAVRDDASDKLARIRRQIEEGNASIRGVLQRLLRDPAILRLLQFSNYTFSNDRMVLPVRAECRGKIPGIIHRSSDSGATVYIEPSEVVELNNEIGKLRADEDEEISRLLWELTHEIHINEEAILKTLDALAVLDLVIAKVRFARAFGMMCPQINEAGRIRLRGARHPLLLDLAHKKREAGEVPAEIVAIDVRLGEDFDMLVITGPNTGGKTVMLKTVGLICLMVQAGLPVPVAAGSDVGLFQNIMIDIGDEQSIQQSLSTFSAHLKRLMEMLQRAGERTLVLIDELGAGTDPDEGAAIGRAILDELLRRQTRCIATTHLGALKGYALTRDRVENGCVEFDAKTLSPTYHLRIGEPGNSNAIDIAERLGMPRRLVEAARRNLSRKGRALRAAIDGTVESKRRAEEARAAAETAQVAAGDAHAQAVAAHADLQKRQSDFHEWVRHVVHLRAGDAVRVRNFDRDGRVVRIHIEQQRAEIDIGAFAVEVPLGDVLPPLAPPPPPPLETRRVGSRMRGPAPMPAGNGPQRRGDNRFERPQQPRNNQPVRHGPPRGDEGQNRDNRRPPDARGGGPNRPDERPKPILPSLTDVQGAELKPGDSVIAKRFHRIGKVVRVKAGKKVAIVSVGALELELPFDGLAMPPTPEPRAVATHKPALDANQNVRKPIVAVPGGIEGAAASVAAAEPGANLNSNSA